MFIKKEQYIRGEKQFRFCWIYCWHVLTIVWVNLCRVAKSTDARAGLYKEWHVLAAAQNAPWTLLQYAVGTYYTVGRLWCLGME